MSFRVRFAAAVLALLPAACAAPVTPPELSRIDQFDGYRYAAVDKLAPKDTDKSAVAMTFSGGGTRAAALADGALRALLKTEVPGRSGMVPLSSQIDMLSSVSGGSVTAASFALYGADGLQRLEQDFLYQDVMGDLIGRVLLNPTRLLYPRVKTLADYFDDNLFAHKTYQALLSDNKAGRDRRPFAVLNAADMEHGAVFSFTQDQFDLLCGNLSGVRIADAVASSAAFPVALSAVTVANRAPCPAQAMAPQDRVRSGWIQGQNGPEPQRLANDRAADTSKDGLITPKAGQFGRYRDGNRALNYLNRDGNQAYVQLLDGGIADNVGLTLPLAALTPGNAVPSFFNQAQTGKIDKMLLVVVNARSQADHDYGRSDTSPGVFGMLSGVLDTAIDGNSFKLLDQVVRTRQQDLGLLTTFQLALVDFDLIADAGCRDRFHTIATTWSLSQAEVKALIAMGEAMVLQSDSYRAFVTAIGGTAPAPTQTVADICRETVDWRD